MLDSQDAVLQMQLSNRGAAKRLPRDYHAVIAECTAKLSENPRHVEALRYRALCHFRLGEDSAALTDYTALLELEPQNTDALYHRGAVLQRQACIDEAIADYSAVLRLDPHHAKALLARATCWNVKGHWQQAIEEYNTALEFDKQGSDVTKWRSQASPHTSQQLHFRHSPHTQTQGIRALTSLPPPHTGGSGRLASSGSSNSLDPQGSAAPQANGLRQQHQHPQRPLREAPSPLQLLPGGTEPQPPLIAATNGIGVIHSGVSHTHALSRNTSLSDLSAAGWDQLRRTSNPSPCSTNTTPQSGTPDPPASIGDDEPGWHCAPLSGAAAGTHVGNCQPPLSATALGDDSMHCTESEAARVASGHASPMQQQQEPQDVSAAAVRAVEPSVHDSLGAWLESRPAAVTGTGAGAGSADRGFSAGAAEGIEDGGSPGPGEGGSGGSSGSLVDVLKHVGLSEPPQSYLGSTSPPPSLAGGRQLLEQQLTQQCAQQQREQQQEKQQQEQQQQQERLSSVDIGHQSQRLQMRSGQSRFLSGGSHPHVSIAHMGHSSTQQLKQKPEQPYQEQHHQEHPAPHAHSYSTSPRLQKPRVPRNSLPGSAASTTPIRPAFSQQAKASVPSQPPRNGNVARPASSGARVTFPPSHTARPGAAAALDAVRNALSKELRSPSPFERLVVDDGRPRGGAGAGSGPGSGGGSVRGTSHGSGVGPWSGRVVASAGGGEMPRGTQSARQVATWGGGPGSAPRGQSTPAAPGSKLHQQQQQQRPNGQTYAQASVQSVGELPAPGLGRTRESSGGGQEGAAAEANVQGQATPPMHNAMQQGQQHEQQPLAPTWMGGSPAGSPPSAPTMGFATPPSAATATGPHGANPQRQQLLLQPSAGPVGDPRSGGDSAAGTGHEGWLQPGGGDVNGSSGGGGGGVDAMAAALEMSRPSTSSSAASEPDGGSRRGGPGHRLAEAHNARAQALRQQGQLQEAVREYGRALEAEPGNFKALFNRGFTHDRLGELVRAVEDYSAALAVDPASSYAHYNRGITRDRLQDYAGAVEDFTCAIRLEPGNADFYHNRGFALRKMGQFAAAIDDYTSAVRLNPQHCRAYYNRAFCHDRLNNVQQAIDDYTRALEMEPGNATALHNRGSLHERAGRPDLAIADFSRAVQCDPSCAPALNARGVLLLAAGRPQAALADLDAALAVLPGSAPLLRNRAQCRREMGDYAGAVQDLTRALELDPSDLLSYTRRAHAFRRMGEYEAAVGDYTKALSLSPSNPKLHTVRAYCYAMIGWFAEAVADYDAVLGLEPGNAHAAYNRAVAAEKLGASIDRAAADLAAAAAAGTTLAGAGAGQGAAVRVGTPGRQPVRS